VLGTADLVNAILTALADGDAEEACIAAINWCDLSKAHQGMCNDEDAWEQLALAIFADDNGNFPIAHPGGRWEEYFRMLCEHLVAQRRAEEAAEQRRIEGVAQANRELANRSIRKYKESLAARMHRYEDLAEQYRRAKQEGARGEREAEIIELMGEAEALMQQAADSGRAVRNEIRQVVDALDKLWNMQGAMVSGAFWRPTPAQVALQRAMQVLRRAMEQEEITETVPAEAVTTDDDSD
jgi:hypothetical protein